MVSKNLDVSSKIIMIKYINDKEGYFMKALWSIIKASK